MDNPSKIKSSIITKLLTQFLQDCGTQMGKSIYTSKIIVPRKNSPDQRHQQIHTHKHPYSQDEKMKTDGWWNMSPLCRGAIGHWPGLWVIVMVKHTGASVVESWAMAEVADMCGDLPFRFCSMPHLSLSLSLLSTYTSITSGFYVNINHS